MSTWGNLQEQDTVLDRLGTRLQGLHPLGATLAVAAAGYGVLVGFALLLGALVTNFVVGGGLGDGDLRIERWLAARRTPTWTDLSVIGSYFAETVTVLVIVAIFVLVLAVHRHWPEVGLIVVSISLEALVYLVATYFVTRNRPAVPRLEDLIVADSFPSGHTAASVALYGSLAIVVWAVTRNRWLRALFLALAMFAPVVVAASRMYRGMHNPTDVMSGALIGAGCVAVAYLAVRTGVAVARLRTVQDAGGASRRVVNAREVVVS